MFVYEFRKCDTSKSLYMYAYTHALVILLILSPFIFVVLLASSLSVLQSSVKKGRGNAGTCASESQTSESPTNSFQEPEARIQSDRPYSLSAELESEGTGLLMEGYFSQHCDSASLSSFSLDTPALPRRSPPQDDTASLVSTGTLVPEAIYLPPPGHRLVTHSDWDALNAQVNKPE